MHLFGIWLASAALVFASATDEFVAAAKVRHGAVGEKAARFLVEHMSAADKESLSAEFLTNNLDLAFEARERFPWAKAVPEAIFLNDVLPYAVFDEPRDAWRADFLEKATPLVKDATTATEAVQALNQGFFKRINTHYHTGRKRTNQSPKESMAQGKATCTGLSILLVDACRAVGIPARAVGTPMWSNGRGNHTWVEIWDGDWHFTGADEYDAAGLDRGWFTGDAAKADANRAEHAIYATSWKRDGLAFPMVWAPGSTAVAGVNVTGRYAAATLAKHELGIRFFEGEERRALKGRLLSKDGAVVAEFETKAGTADLNDMPQMSVKPGERYRLSFEVEGKWRQTAEFTATAETETRDLRAANLEPMGIGAGL
ncbi:MAG: transglutaminase domain-containing protein [Verrucomicrobiota bacterium]